MYKNENGFSIYFGRTTIARLAVALFCLLGMTACSTPRLWKNPHKGLADDLSGNAKARARTTGNRFITKKSSAVESDISRNVLESERDVNQDSESSDDSSLVQDNPKKEHNVEANGEGGLIWPTNPVIITSPFGKRGKHAHEGVDLKASVGTEVYAAGDGIVVYSGTRIRGYGKLIVIKHSNDLATVYGHCSESRVVKDQRVKKGELIALSGQTGRASGPHLHFEVRKGVDAIDSVAYFGDLPASATRTLASTSAKSKSLVRSNSNRRHDKRSKTRHSAIQETSDASKKVVRKKNVKATKIAQSKKNKKVEKVVKN